MLYLAIEALMEYLHFAKQLAISAGNLIVEKRELPMNYIAKDARDIVTDADFESQKLITETIREKYPDHGFLTEEVDETLPSGKGITWIIDPIDGTINYSRGQPIYTVSIGMAIENEIVLGVIFDPLRNELFTASKGGGFFVNDVNHRASNIRDFDQSVLCFDWKNKKSLRQNNLLLLNKIIHEVRTVNVLGSAALALAWVAAGRLDGYFNFDLDVWDVAAGSIMIREAGGLVTDYSGEIWDWRNSDRTCAATNGLIHSRLVEFILKTEFI